MQRGQRHDLAAVAAVLLLLFDLRSCVECASAPHRERLGGRRGLRDNTTPGAPVALGCAVVIEYTVELVGVPPGGGGDATPLFSGRATAVLLASASSAQPGAAAPANAPAGSVTSWVMGGTLVGGERITTRIQASGEADPTAVYVESVGNASADSSGARGQAWRFAVEGRTVLRPPNGNTTISFTGERGPPQPGIPDAPGLAYGVAVPERVFFNDLSCTLLPNGTEQLAGVGLPPCSAHAQGFACQHTTGGEASCSLAASFCCAPSNQSHPVSPVPPESRLIERRVLKQEGEAYGVP
ncbi:hypothetical protein FOA52_002995 [Chlamydomonas sp. UWO 241]|nr:hypothetical protein FOA52_002995 [Chlamydomonas sp. UWO 241]